MMIRRAVTVTAAVALVGLAAGPALAMPAPRDAQVSARHHGTIHFTAQRMTVQPIDLGPAGPSAGDETLIGGRIVSGNARGFTSADCVTVSSEDNEIDQCEVDFLLSHGDLLTRGVSGGDAQGVSLVVVGGTGRYADARGTGSLTPTSSGSVVKLRLR